jgi:hypothetical protein
MLAKASGDGTPGTSVTNMTEDRIRQLEEIGFLWTSPNIQALGVTPRNPFPIEEAAAMHTFDSSNRDEQQQMLFMDPTRVGLLGAMSDIMSPQDELNHHSVTLYSTEV